MNRLATLWMLGASLFAPLDSLDQVVQRAVQAARRPALERPVWVVNQFGLHVVVAGLLIGVAVLDRAAGIETVRTALITLVPTNALVEGLKLACNRIRPDGTRRRANSSFPSSHAANAFALALVLSRRWRRLAPGFLTIAAAVGFARIYLNRHFLSDVVVGAAIGVLSGWAVARWREKRRTARAAAGP